MGIAHFLDVAKSLKLPIFFLISFILKGIFSGLFSIAFAAPPSGSVHDPVAFPISALELTNLVKELTPKVDLFAEIWKVDPKAELYGGTTRDFLYWILGHFNGLKTVDDIKNMKDRLRSREFIKIMEILGPESDADIVAADSSRLAALHGYDFGIRKLDLIQASRLDLATEEGRSEVDQGYISVEKMRIGVGGLISQAPFEDGLKDLISGKISIQFPDPNKFWTTTYAKNGQNHPIFLSLRYLRILAQDYLRRYGSDFPDMDKLMAGMSPEIKGRLKREIKEAFSDPRFLKVLRDEKARSWINATIQKSFRSYSNPTAAFNLFKEMGVLDLIEAFSSELESVYGYLLRIHRDENSIHQAFRKYHASEENIYRPVSNYLPDFELLHGTRTESAFRGIIYLGILPSESGSAGAGFYGVDRSNIEFAKEWSTNGSASDPGDRVVAVKLNSNTRVIDISEGPGKALWERWSRKRGDGGDSSAKKNLEDEFAREFGADLLVYGYSFEGLLGGKALVLKNSSVVLKRRGVFRNPIPIEELFQRAAALTRENIISFLKDFLMTPLLMGERQRVLSSIDRKLYRWLLRPSQRNWLENELGPLIYSWLANLKSVNEKVAGEWSISLLLKDFSNLKTNREFRALLDLVPQWPESIWTEVIRNFDWSFHELDQNVQKQKTYPPQVWPLLMEKFHGLARGTLSTGHSSFFFWTIDRNWPKQLVNSFVDELHSPKAVFSHSLVMSFAVLDLSRSKFFKLLKKGLMTPGLQVTNNLLRVLEHIPNFSKKTWKLLFSFKTCKLNLEVRQRVIKFLSKKDVWPPYVFKWIQKGLLSESSQVKYFMQRLLEGARDWPESFWKFYLNYLDSHMTSPRKGPVDSFVFMEHLRAAQNWPEEMWTWLLDRLIDDESLWYGIIVDVFRQKSVWDPRLWKKIPEIFESLKKREDGAAYLNLFADALKKQAHWSDEAFLAAKNLNIIFSLPRQDFRSGFEISIDDFSTESGWSHISVGDKLRMMPQYFNHPRNRHGGDDQKIIHRVDSNGTILFESLEGSHSRECRDELGSLRF